MDLAAIARWWRARPLRCALSTTTIVALALLHTACGSPPPPASPPVAKPAAPVPSPPPAQKRVVAGGAAPALRSFGRCAVGKVHDGAVSGLAIVSEQDRYMVLVPESNHVEIGCDDALLARTPNLVLAVRYASLDVEVRLFSQELGFVASEKATLAAMIDATLKVLGPKVSDVATQVTGKSGALLGTMRGFVAVKGKKSAFTTFMSVRQRPADKRIYKLVVTLGDVTDEVRDEWRALMLLPDNPLTDGPSSVPGTTLARAEGPPRAL